MKLLIKDVRIYMAQMGVFPMLYLGVRSYAINN